MLRTLSLLLSLSFFSLDILAQSNPDDLLGLWTAGSGKVHVKIEKVGNKYYGKIVWLKIPIDPITQKPKTDKNNPNESLRNTPLKGCRILKDFESKGEGVWKNGTIYDPENGKTYSCYIKMRDINTLDIRGYIGISAIGRTDVWKRYEPSKDDVKLH